MNCSLLCVLLIFLLSTLLGAQERRGCSLDERTDLRPPAIYVDHGAYPFEGCIYRRWRATTKVSLYDRPHGRPVQQLFAGMRVFALTGSVHSIPRAVHSPIDLPTDGVRKGDLIYVIDYSGEGYWTFWFRGCIFTEELNILPEQEPHTEWWARIELSNSLRGWVRAEANFSNQDRFGKPNDPDR